jgi:hypothetical protein
VVGHWPPTTGQRPPGRTHLAGGEAELGDKVLPRMITRGRGARSAWGGGHGRCYRLREAEHVLLHCASGHGRSAMVAVALVLEHGQANDIEQAEA